MHRESKSGMLGGALWCLFTLVAFPVHAICPDPPPPPTTCINAKGCYGMTECDDYPRCGSFSGVSNVACTVCGDQGHVRCDWEGNLIAGSCSAYGEEKCDACDNDGDSLIDEGPDGGVLTGGACDPLSNGCTGTRTCSAGQFQCVIPSGTRRHCDEPKYGCENATAACQPDGTHGPCRPATTTQEKCNGCDDNWDGFVDNLPGQGAGTLTQECRTTAGTCAGSVQACIVQDSISMWGQCVAPTESCNGLDDDCDGNIDEGDVCALYCTCTPTTCASQGKTCGSVPDGCGGTLSCGTCPAGQACGAANTCDTVTCPPSQYLCCDQLTCSPQKGCPEMACGPGGGGDEGSSSEPLP
ncbi:hypothetical protein HV824_07575 [Myxococcus sp. AM009]|uniref:hypothetical protein n=1 Tax=unclassified Myxococcus TaxID=2648731 RepID=UPI0015951DA4|nr:MULTISPECIES: hypothetical protein [unclassified Myxococcus]NVI97979.1 hypothetical protein [Myxococcus sp. AM009]NVJ15579.1 hypothetical protein [Myxococcus sp. AM010]